MDVVAWFNDVVPFILLGACVYLCFRMRGMPLRYVGYALRMLRRQDAYAQGEISAFQAMLTSQAMSMHTGCILGTATAVLFGGFGALFWVICIGVLSMCVKFAEGLLAIKYRSVNQKKEICGGPMHYIAQGLGSRGWAVCFACLGMVMALCSAAFVHMPSMAMGLAHASSVSLWGIGTVLLLLLVAVLSGGIKRIAQTCSFLVVLMTLIYSGAALVILISHLDDIPRALYAICRSAFSSKALFGGIFGLSITTAIQYGVQWGMASHLIGMGVSSAPIAAAKTDVPGRQALIGMGGYFLCLVLSLITGLVLFVTRSTATTALDPAVLVMNAFRTAIPAGDRLVLITLFCLGWAALPAWAYFGERCLESISGGKGGIGFRMVFCAVAFLGFTMPSHAALIGLMSLLANCMFLLHMGALTALSSVISIETRTFFDVVEKERRQETAAELLE